MQLNFRNFALVASAVCFGLSLVLLLAPQVLLNLWGVAFSESVAVICRRASMLFLGFGVMFFLSRDAAFSVARQALLVGFGVACTALAVLGLVELNAGHVGPGIWLAAAVELVLAGACFAVWRKSGAEHALQAGPAQARAEA